jgi:hypothetical protein
MRHRDPAVPFSGLAAGLALLLCAFAAAPALAAPSIFTASLDGLSESPPNGSTGTGFSQVEFDPVAHTMRVYADFLDLVGTTTVCHIHGPTLVAGSGTAGVATTTPTFPGFPTGVTAGTYDQTFDMTQASSYNPSFVTANGGTTASAEAALYQALLDGKAYFNLHTTSYGGGEIRGFLQLVDPTPTEQQSWGRIKTMYR